MKVKRRRGEYIKAVFLLRTSAVGKLFVALALGPVDFGAAMLRIAALERCVRIERTAVNIVDQLHVIGTFIDGGGHPGAVFDPIAGITGEDVASGGIVGGQHEGISQSPE